MAKAILRASCWWKSTTQIKRLKGLTLALRATGQFALREGRDISLYRFRWHRQYQGLVPASQTIGPGEIRAAIERLATAILERHGSSGPLLILGIANGGIEVARRLAACLVALASGISVKVGTVDISFHRDDIRRNPIPKEFAPTHIPGDVSGATIILVDDVLYSGRTIKAALDELFDHGRPTKVELAILVDRGGRRLPIIADYCGLAVSVTEAQKVVVLLDAKQPERDEIRIEPATNRNAAL